MSGIMGLVNLLVFIGLVILVIYFIVLKPIKRYEKRANEQLMLQRENTLTLQNRIDDLNERLAGIEKMLKEVE
ncbi:hypothetical protein V7147_10430 [Bacillus sp. JJ1521]|uniref:hypothetical protein n=1 Tax=Bacillus sp. JJ1521 TaxID=3122957 RepID=UPI0030009426